MIKIIKGCFVVALLLFVPVFVLGQSVPQSYGFLEVVDFSGKPIEGAQINSYKGKSVPGYVTNARGLHTKGIGFHSGDSQGFIVEKAGYHRYINYFDVFGQLRRGKRKNAPVQLMLLSTNTKSEIERREQTKREMFIAARMGDAGTVRQLLKMGISPDLSIGDLIGIPVKKSSSLIQQAAQYGHSDTVMLLFQAGEPKGAKRNTDILMRLMKAGPVNSSNSRTPKEDAEKVDRLEDAALLIIEAGVETGISKSYDYDPVMGASRKGYLRVVRQLLADGASANSVTGSGVTTLVFAVSGSAKSEVKISIIEELIANGADMNHATSKGRNCSGSSPLAYAALSGDIKVVEFLLGEGADPNLKCGRQNLLDKMRNSYFSDKKVMLKVESLLMSAGAVSNEF